MHGSSVYPRDTYSASPVTAIRPPSSVSLLADQLKLSSLNESPCNLEHPPRLISIDRTALYLRRLSSRRLQPDNTGEQTIQNHSDRDTELGQEIQTGSGTEASEPISRDDDSRKHQIPSSPRWIEESRDNVKFYPSSAPNSSCLTTSSSLPAFTFTSTCLHAASKAVPPAAAAWRTTTTVSSGEPLRCCAEVVKCHCLTTNEHNIPCKRVCRSLSARTARQPLSHHSSQFPLRDAAALELYRSTLPRPVALRLTSAEPRTDLFSQSNAPGSTPLRRPKCEIDRSVRLSWHHPYSMITPTHGQLSSAELDLVASSTGRTQPVPLGPSRTRCTARTPGIPSSCDSGNSYSSGPDLSVSRGFSAFTPTRRRCDSEQDDMAQSLDYSSSPITGSGPSCGGPFPVLTPSSGFHDMPFYFSESSSLPDHIRSYEDRDQFTTLTGRHLRAKEISHDHTGSSSTAGLKRRRGPSGEVEPLEQNVSDCEACQRHSETSDIRSGSPKSIFDRQETLVPAESACPNPDPSSSTRDELNVESSASDLFIFGFNASVCGDRSLPEATLTRSCSPTEHVLGSPPLFACNSHQLITEAAIQISPPCRLWGENANHKRISPNLVEHHCHHTCAALGGLNESVDEKEEEVLSKIDAAPEHVCHSDFDCCSVQMPALSPSIFDVTFEPIRDPNEQQSLFLSSASFFPTTGRSTANHVKNLSEAGPVDSSCDILIPLSSGGSDEASDDEHILSPQLLNRQKITEGCAGHSLPGSSLTQVIDLSLIEEN